MKQHRLSTAFSYRITTNNPEIKYIPDAEPKGPVSCYVGRSDAAIFYVVWEVDT